MDTMVDDGVVVRQVMDAMVDDGVVVRQHIYRVRDAGDAHQTVQRHRASNHSKHILVDLPTSQCEQFLKLQVRLATTPRAAR